MVYTAGIDIGSASSKGVLFCDGGWVASFEMPSGGDLQSAARRVREALLFEAGIAMSQIARTVATGYGSKSVAFADEAKPDIVCHAKAVSSLLPFVRTVVDVGDLHTKVFRIDHRGGVHKFLSSGNCAGGSGRILQVIAKVLQVRLDEIGELSLQSKRRVEFSTGCAVFAESEAVSLLAEEVRKEDLLAGLHRALAAQVNSLLERTGVEPELALVGGGAKDAGLIRALEEITKHQVFVPPHPQLTGAFGAAKVAAETLSLRHEDGVKT